MKLIAIDSSTEACSVAILQDTDVIESWQLAPREHTRMLLPMVDQLLAESSLSLSQLDAVAFACGTTYWSENLRVAQATWTTDLA